MAPATKPGYGYLECSMLFLVRCRALSVSSHTEIKQHGEPHRRRCRLAAQARPAPATRQRQMAGCRRCWHLVGQQTSPGSRQAAAASVRASPPQRLGQCAPGRRAARSGRRSAARGCCAHPAGGPCREGTPQRGTGREPAWPAASARAWRSSCVPRETESVSAGTPAAAAAEAAWQLPVPHQELRQVTAWLPTACNPRLAGTDVQFYRLTESYTCKLTL